MYQLPAYDCSWPELVIQMLDDMVHARFTKHDVEGAVNLNRSFMLIG